MNQEQTCVQVFHERYGALINKEPTMLDSKTLILRARLICEESVEFLSAVSKNDFPEMVDSLCDLLYVVYGTAVSLGVDLEPFLQVRFYGMNYRLGGREQNPGVKLPTRTIAVPDAQSGGTMSDVLIRESNVFLQAALGRGMTKMVFSLCDLVMYIYATAAQMGVDLDPVFAEVQRSNMTKDGGGKDSGGKIVKGPNFKLPDIVGKLQEQGWINT